MHTNNRPIICCCDSDNKWRYEQNINKQELSACVRNTSLVSAYDENAALPVQCVHQCEISHTYANTLTSTCAQPRHSYGDCTNRQMCVNIYVSMNSRHGKRHVTAVVKLWLCVAALQSTSLDTYATPANKTKIKIGTAPLFCSNLSNSLQSFHQTYGPIMRQYSLGQ